MSYDTQKNLQDCRGMSTQRKREGGRQGSEQCNNPLDKTFLNYVLIHIFMVGKQCNQHR